MNSLDASLSREREMLLCFRAMIDRRVEIQKDLCICFIDYAKAFDRVKHDRLLELIARVDIDGEDLRLIRNLYYHQKATVRIMGELF